MPNSGYKEGPGTEVPLKYQKYSNLYKNDLPEKSGPLICANHEFPYFFQFERLNEFLNAALEVCAMCSFPEPCQP